ncbi:secreted insect toxic protein [Metarhizium album ARSEF 1941]|uniref:Secreted insect toxic protein n=1 Tax=Metarhizium album (strain ARSEF 1941) TaxID=1081103 RepID=A0A0B2WSX6_METAS|nr:secreted insect toxic protein [Metarhizium album ARSEF 1941]KHN96592.1 secreted insect toxic protein [Metarhizium album ARSEF 1941]
MAVAASAVRVSWDGGYDRPDRSLRDVSCSDGRTGLMPRFQRQSDLPNFPNIGGAAAIEGWGSQNCGTCWKLEYNGISIKVLAVDHAGDGFNIGKTALNALTNGRAEEFGYVDAAVTPLAPRDCGL